MPIIREKCLCEKHCNGVKKTFYEKMLADMQEQQKKLEKEVTKSRAVAGSNNPTAEACIPIFIRTRSQNFVQQSVKKQYNRSAV